MILRTAVPFEPTDELIHAYLRHWAMTRPRQTFLAERTAVADHWQTISYSEAYDAAARLATSFVALGLGPERPSCPATPSCTSWLRCRDDGIPYTPLSVAYSTMSGDLGKLRAILKILDPGLVFAADAAPFARTLAIDEMIGREILLGTGHETVKRAISLASLLQTPIDHAVTGRAGELSPQTIAKILFTSGSTGTPKGVPTTHRMMCTSLSQIEAMWPFMQGRTPGILDWLPWSHVFGGSFSFNSVLRYGGTLYIDDGKPVPGEIARTLRNLREVRPTLYRNVPRGYEFLLPLLQGDAEARQNLPGANVLCRRKPSGTALAATGSARKAHH
jgi:feruloyl-CoA synthase